MLKKSRIVSLLSISFSALAVSQTSFADSASAFKEVKILDCQVDYPAGPNPIIFLKGKTVQVRAEEQAHLELYLTTNGKFVSTLRGSFTTPVLNKWQAGGEQYFMPKYFYNIAREGQRGDDENTDDNDVQVSSVSEKRNPWGAKTKSIVIGLSSDTRISMAAEDGYSVSHLGQITLDQGNGSDKTLVSLRDKNGVPLLNGYKQELSFVIPAKLADDVSSDKCSVQNYKILQQLAAQ